MLTNLSFFSPILPLALLLTLTQCATVRPVGTLGAVLGNPHMKAKPTSPSAYMHVPPVAESQGALRFETTF